MTSRFTQLGQQRVARIGLGTNRLRNTPENVAFIRAAVDAGVQMIDTAHLYTNGESERTIGRALSPIPPGVVVATKGGHFAYGSPATPEVLHREIEQSFKSLGTDRIALYYLHRVDPNVPIEESLGAIKDFVDRGTIEHVGISEVDIPMIERARKVVPIAAVQNHYNLTEREFDDVVDYCERDGIAFVPFYPLHGEPSEAVKGIAKRHRATPKQVLLAWLLARSPVMLPIPGTLSLEHLKENLGAVGIELTTAEMRELG